jgi:hypothetical protein
LPEQNGDRRVRIGIPHGLKGGKRPDDVTDIAKLDDQDAPQLRRSAKAICNVHGFVSISMYAFRHDRPQANPFSLEKQCNVSG